jgi:hypothetical protein
MARKVTPQAPAAAEPDSAASGLSALKPDITLEIAGRKVTIREYGFFEGLEVANQAAGFVADMHAQCVDGSLNYSKVRRLFGVHQAEVIAIAAQAGDVEPEWLRGLTPKDGEYYMSTWFAVNCGFFVHELVVEGQVQAQAQRQRSAPPSTGLASSPASPPPGSATSTASDASPSGN